MAGRHRDRDRRPARRRPTLEPKRRLLVVCEGERTEPDYIRGFERLVSNATVAIEIPRERGDPRGLVEIATRLRAEAAEAARVQGDPFLAFDEVWCVFDRDQFEHFREAVETARGRGIELAVSNPCVELWILLHFRDSPGARDRHDLQQMVKKHLPGYAKRLDFSLVASGVAGATERARRLDSDAASMGEDLRNPTTSFYRLTDSIGRRT
jgi:hypothetical protein